MQQPLPGREQTVSDALAENEGEAFMSLMQQHAANVGSG